MRPSFRLLALAGTVAIATSGVAAVPPVVAATASSVVTTAAPVTTPAKPVIGRIVRGKPGGKRSIALSWRAPKDTGGAPIDRYRVSIHQVDKNNRVLRRLSSGPLGGDTIGITFTDLGPGRFNFSVQAHNKAGWGLWSNRSGAVFAR